RVITTRSPCARSRAARLRATASATSFSSTPENPFAPTSEPPWPASITTVSNRSAADAVAVGPSSGAARASASCRLRNAPVPTPLTGSPDSFGNVTHRPIAPRRSSLRFQVVSVHVTRAMSRPLAILGTLALPLSASAGEVVCPPGAELRGEAPPAGHQQWCEDAEHRQHGPSVSWDEQQRKRIEAHFEHGAMQGAYRSWHENGRLGISGSYANDRREGLWEAWYPDGTRARTQEYRAGRQHGIAREWYPNGQLRFEEHYVEGERQGAAVAYYENGQKQSEGSFERGAFDG